MGRAGRSGPPTAASSRSWRAGSSKRTRGTAGPPGGGGGVTPDSAHGTTEVGWPEFLPDGRHFLYLTLGLQPHLRVGSLDSKESKDLGPCESQIKYVRPGYLLFSRSGALVAQRFDTGSLKF